VWVGVGLGVYVCAGLGVGAGGRQIFCFVNLFFILFLDSAAAERRQIFGFVNFFIFFPTAPQPSVVKFSSVVGNPVFSSMFLTIKKLSKSVYELTRPLRER
jgi:hypothetical protein